MAACGLNPTEWDQVPPIHGKITQDGRTASAVRASLEQEYRATVLASEFPSSPFFSTQLVQDAKDVRFGWQDSHSHQTCHRGISPFVLPHTAIESHAALRMLEEDAEQATSTTIADVRSGRTGPPPCPTDYYGLLQMLGSYVKFLMMLFGPRCDHLAQVSATCFCLLGRVAMFQKMTKEQVGHLLWTIFIDARCFFSTPHDVMDNPPVSRLEWFVSAVNGGSLPTSIGTPLLSMFGSTTPRNPLLAPGNQGGSQDTGPRINTQVHMRIAAATAAAISCTATVNFRAVIAQAAAPKPQLSSLSLHRAGCFDFLFFGKCNNRNCSFKHTGEVTESKIDGVLAKMRPVLARFVAANATS